jgi:hypothetical protein
MVVIKLTKLMTIREATNMLDWLEANVEYKFTSEGMAEITFSNDEDATAFRLRFGV